MGDHWQKGSQVAAQRALVATTHNVVCGALVPGTSFHEEACKNAAYGPSEAVDYPGALQE